jgi:predicted dienelactone hydrolase
LLYLTVISKDNMKKKTANSTPANGSGHFLKLLRFIKKLLKGIVVLIGIVVACILICLILLFFEHNSQLALPLPTGPYAVGRTSYDWVDTTRTDSLAPIPNQKRELLVWIWYPMKKSPLSKPAEYMPGPLRNALKKKQGFIFSTFFSHDESKIHNHSMVNGAVSPQERSYPVVIMRSGGGALAIDYTTMAEDLASHGYIVVGTDAPYTTTVVIFPNGRIINSTANGNPGDQEASAEQEHRLNRLIKLCSADTHFIVDKLQNLNSQDPSGKFTGKLNMSALGIFGHSFGGAIAAQFCHDDTRCKAGIDIDGQPFGSVIKEGVHQPFMFMLGDHPMEQGSKQILSNIQSIYDRLPENDRLWITVHGARHFNFSDQALIKDSHITRLIGAIGPIEERRGLAITSAYIRWFFDIYLKKAANTSLKKPLPDYPEVKLDSRQKP